MVGDENVFTKMWFISVINIESETYVKSSLQENDSLPDSVTYVPLILCQIFIIGKFLIVLFKERKNFGQLFYDEVFQNLVQNELFMFSLSKILIYLQTKDNSINVKLSLPWFNDYVKNIFYPR